MIGDILEIARTLFGLGEKFTKARAERRARIADYFGAISQTISKVSESLKENEVPHGKCAEMATYADLLPETIGDVIGSEKAKELSTRLKDAHEVEMLLYDLHNAPDRDQELAQLDEAAGLFKALANSIRVAR